MSNNLFSTIQGQMQAHGTRTLMEEPGGRHYSFSGAFEITGRLANRLASLGVQPGDRVAVQVDKSPETLLLYLACLRAGAVYLPLNTAYTGGEISYFLGDAQPALFVCRPADKSKQQPLADAAGAQLKTLGTELDGSLVHALDAESAIH